VTAKVAGSQRTKATDQSKGRGQSAPASSPAAPEGHSKTAGSDRTNPDHPKKAAEGLSTPKECSTMSEVQTAAAAHTHDAPLIGVLMGSSSDWDVMKNAVAILQEFGVPYEAKVVSAHRMPDEMFAYAESARERGLVAIIAGAGGAAHLPGMLAAKTTLPVLGVPVSSKYLKGVDSLHSIVQMPKGVPVATFAIGEAGAANAALFAVSLLAVTQTAYADKLAAFRARQNKAAHAMVLPPL
jgi:5-(carboxyamino)imidazole ribonucleotide mutase